MLSLEPFKRINQKRKFSEDLNTEFAYRALKQKAKPVFSAQPQQQHLFPALATREQSKALGLLRDSPLPSLLFCAHASSQRSFAKDRRKDKEVALREAGHTQQPREGQVKM